jgi:imidazoleglycerol-phosphate dehydratase
VAPAPNVGCEAAALPLCAILRKCPGPAFTGLATVITAPGILPSPTTGGDAVQPPSSAPATGPLPRLATIQRKTRETDITVRLDLGGSGRATIDTGLGFFDHMLELVAGHGLFDLEVRAAGDLQTGGHHTVEDVGICLGQALAEALGDKKGINRYGSSFVPMDEALALVALDLSGRPFFAYEGGPVAESIGGFDTGLVAEFFRALANNARLTMHARVLAGGDAHHVIEAVFKAFGRALRLVVTSDPRVAGIPSTKGVL